MSLYTTSRGFGVDWRDEFGRRHRKFVGNEEAARRLDALLRDQSAISRRALANYRSAASLSLLAGIDLYLAHAPHAPVTREFQRERLTRSAQRLGNPDVTAVTPALLEAWSSVRRTEVSPATLTREHQLLRTLFNYLVESFHLPASPAVALARGPVIHTSLIAFSGPFRRGWFCARLPVPQVLPAGAAACP